MVGLIVGVLACKGAGGVGKGVMGVGGETRGAEVEALGIERLSAWAVEESVGDELEAGVAGWMGGLCAGGEFGVDDGLDEEAWETWWMGSAVGWEVGGMSVSRSKCCLGIPVAVMSVTPSASRLPS